MAVLKGGSGARKNDGVNEVLVMVVDVKEWFQYRLADHVGDLGCKINTNFDIKVGARDMTRAWGQDIFLLRWVVVGLGDQVLLVVPPEWRWWY